jgi:hypothetical protein
MFHQHLLKFPFSVVLPLRLSVGSDSADIIALLRNHNGQPRERALVHQVRALQGKVMVVPLLSFRDSLNDGSIVLFKVPTNDNIADALTKAMSVAALRTLLDGRRAHIYTEDDAQQTADENVHVPMPVPDNARFRDRFPRNVHPPRRLLEEL